MNDFTNPRLPRYSAPDKSTIDLVVTFPGIGDAAYTALSGSPLFARAEAGEFGEVARYVHSIAPHALAARIERICAERVSALIGAKAASMLREQAFVLSLLAEGKTLDDEQKDSLGMFAKINAWETAMIEARDRMIAGRDMRGAENDASWPSPPDGVDAFLKDY